MEEKSKVSVIMAIFNCQDTLSEAIESIINQTYKNWEFIICDDCSTDNSYEIAKSYEKKYPNKFKVIKNSKNSKLSYSLNHCLKYANGKYIARMDGDDISLPQRFEKQVEILDKNLDIAVVGTSMMRFDENGDYSLYEALEKPNKLILKNEVPFCHATIMMRKKVYDKLNGYIVSKRTERGQDLDLWFRFYSKNFQGINLKEVLYRVREDRKAINRRKLKYAIYASQTKWLGFNLIQMPIKYYPFILYPIISYFIPRKLKLSLSNIIHKR